MQRNDAYLAKTYSEQVEENKAFAASWQGLINTERDRVSALQRQDQAERNEISSRSAISEEDHVRIQDIENEFGRYKLFFTQIRHLQAYIDKLSRMNGAGPGNQFESGKRK